MHSFPFPRFVRCLHGAGLPVRVLSAVCATLLLAAPLRAQVSYATANATYVQDFNTGLPAGANNSAEWTDNTHVNFQGWHILRVLNGTPATYRINSASSSGQVQHFRSAAGANDGALGGRPNDTTGGIHYGLRLRNTTGATLRSFTLSYALEQWYMSGSTTPNHMLVSYQIGDPADLASGTWTTVSALTLAAPQLGGTAGDINGSAAENRVTSASITVNGLDWAHNTDLWIRFFDANDSGVDQGLALDDVTFSAAPVHYGRNHYIEYHPGTLPLIVTAPHGGALHPEELADRTYGSTDADANTEDLARKIAAEVEARTGQRPHLIINRLHRLKLDPNRDIVEGAQGDPNTEIAWNDYHGFVQDARAAVETVHGFGLLTDIHGHGHEIQRLELGYNISGTNLDKSDPELERPSYAENSSMRTLTYQPGVSFPVLLRGARSLGDLFARRNYPTVPSPSAPGPDGAAYFAGGYTTEEHGSLRDLGNIQAVQIECNFTGVRNSNSNRTAFAKAVAATAHDFLYDHYGYELGTSSTFTLSTSADRIYENGAGLTLTVTRSGFVAFAESMALAFSGTATLGSDYTASATSVSFASGETVKTVTLTPVNDGAAEGAESIVVALAPTPTQTADVLPLTIALSDDDRVSVHVSQAPAELAEGGSAGSVQFTRDLVSGSLTATLAFSGTAVRGLDYEVTGVDGMDRIVFGSGSATQSISLVPLDDSLAEPMKTVVVSVQSGTGYNAGVPAAATVRLRDDDHDAALALWLSDRAGDDVWRDESAQVRDGAFRPTGASGPGTATGVAGTAVEFDGSNDAVVIPPFPVAPAAFTVSFRFRLDATETSTAFRHLLNLGTYDAPDSLTIFRVESNNRIRTLIRDSAGNPSDGTTLDVTGVTANGTWRHYTLTASTATGLRVYLNGTLAASTGTWSGDFAPFAPLWLGWRGEHSFIASRHLKGAMEDVRLFDRALSAAEVAALAAVPATATFTSVASHDGWLRESGENTNVGNSSDSSATSTSALRAGDDSSRRQYRAVVSFDTSTLPAGATILSARLRLRRGTVAGTNPFTTHGRCLVDIRGGSGFGGSTALANGDFEAAADATGVAVLSAATANGDWSEGWISPAGLALINRSGHTQFRIAFESDDNNDSTADYIGWYSGDHGTAGNRPVLEILYR